MMQDIRVKVVGMDKVFGCGEGREDYGLGAFLVNGDSFTS